MTRMISDAQPGHEDYRNNINKILPGTWPMRPEDEGQPHAPTVSHGPLCAVDCIRGIARRVSLRPSVGFRGRQTKANCAFMLFAPTRPSLVSLGTQTPQTSGHAAGRALV